MPIDFFNYAEQIKVVEKFGLIDPSTDTKKEKAYVDYHYENYSNWQAEVICNNRNNYKFIPVDNNIVFPINKKICEAILFTQKTLCFVELKNR